MAVIVHQTQLFFLLCILIIIPDRIRCLNLTILHTNDVHCRFLSFNGQNRVCTEKDLQKNKCWGGAARRMTLIEKFRREQQNVLLLDAGDQYQGTVWFTVFGYKPIVEYMNVMKYDAMTFGNHEFDNGVDGLVPFVKNSTVPFVCSNLDSTGTALEDTYKRSLIKEVDGQKVAIIGYVSTQTPDIAKPGDQLKFKDEIESLKKVVKELKDSGINKIIALGHSGITTDRNICKKVAGVDIVVGGHTNTFLYTGTPPSDEKPEGPYPEVYTETGEKCLVVQEYAYGKYLGYLQVDFDDQGVVQKFLGNPILIDTTIAEDTKIKDMLVPYAKALEETEKETVGMTAVPLDTTLLTCKRQECAMGNMVADAFVYHYLKHKWDLFKSEVSDNGNNEKINNHTDSWTPAAIAFMNSGGLREYHVGAMTNLTLGDLYTILPFSDTVQMVRLKGQHVKDSLEQSVWDFYEDDTHGKFLQVSGIKVVYDLSKPNGHRVVSALVRCSECPTPLYKPLSYDKEYNVITNSYIIDGGNGYYMIKNNIITSDNSDTLDIDVVSDYIRRYEPVMAEIDGRILFVTDENYKINLPNTSATNTISMFCKFLSFIILLTMLKNF